MMFFKRILVLVFLISCFSPSGWSRAVAPNLISAEKPATPLKKGHGYLLINLDVEGTAPSFSFVKLLNSSDRYRSSQNKPKVARKWSETSIPLKNKPDGFYLTSMPAGLYQITEIKAPYYGLPHRLDTDYAPRWRFYIEAGKVNYIGKLQIESERSTKYVDVMLLNRLATDLDAVEKELAHYFTETPLVSGIGSRDDFFEELNNEIQ